MLQRVQYVLGQRNADGTISLISSQNVRQDDAQNILDSVKGVALTSLTPFIGVKDSSKGLVIVGPKANQLFNIVGRSGFTSSNNTKFNLYLFHRLSQGLIFLRSQTSEKVIQGFIQCCKLDSYTGRFDKKSFFAYFSKQEGVVHTALWSSLSQFLAKLDQGYLDNEPTVDMLLRAISTVAPVYSPATDWSLTFDVPLNKFPEDIIFLGAVVAEDSSLISVLLDKQDSYSRSIVQEGYITDSKARASLVNFINEDPFLKAAFATSPSALDGKGISPQKVTEPEEIVKDAMIKIEQTRVKDVYNVNASWIQWWKERTTTE